MNGIDQLTQVLNQYGLKHFRAEKITSRLWKIYSQNGIFALKMSSLTPNTLNKWYDIYQLREKSQLSFILPVFRNLQGNIFTTYQSFIYYVMPWVDQQDSTQMNVSYKDFFGLLGKLHEITKQRHYVNLSLTEEQIKLNKLETEKKFSLLLDYIEQVEQKRYLSPFGLELCTQFHEIETIFHRLNNWYDNYLTDIKDEEIGYQSVCHGFATASHYVANADQGYLINWEHTHIGDPMTEIASFVYYQTATHDTDMSQITQAIPYYEKNYPLTNSQRSLLAIYLLQPDPYLQIIEQYFERKNKQIELIPSLLQDYRRLMAGLMIQEQQQVARDKMLENSQEQ
ncbi:hypothetical protein [Paraliobacillus sp. PM-2]|uniref:hypothetical protein n=1 Tax=Paraliobacillus sp. PM-2 TaxID=1462524 RepID=UPI00114781BA|nr:hypothetical protein [Paraliobacillus sp. PM-2]